MPVAQKPRELKSLKLFKHGSSKVAKRWLVKTAWQRAAMKHYGSAKAHRRFTASVARAVKACG